MKHRDYDDADSGNTETHLAVDTKMRQATEHLEDQLAPAYREGFAEASGVRPEAAEFGGKVYSPEAGDESRPSRVPLSIEEENAGLAES